jgi:protein-disulfide isomerase
MKLGGIAAVQGTPTMFINGARVANPTDFASLSAEIDKALGGSKTPG